MRANTLGCLLRVLAAEQALWLIKSAAFSPIMIVGAFVFPDMLFGMIDASTTRNPSMVKTLHVRSALKIDFHPSCKSQLGLGSCSISRPSPCYLCKKSYVS